STHNTRIEQLWVEVATQFARCWRGFFIRLEKLHRLNCHNPNHLWLLQVLFLDPINADCDAFNAEWNSHPISTMNNCSPIDMRFVSETSHGKVVSDHNEVHPDILQRYYAADGPIMQRRSHQTGAGHPSAEEESEEDEAGTRSETHHPLHEEIAQNVHANINHPAIRVPRSQSPFANSQVEGLFFAALEEIRTAGIVPEGYGVLSMEWDDGCYPTYETIQVGRRARQFMVELPVPVWLPHGIAWCQALHAMQSFIFSLEENQ
ncbi:hypothetical protein JB92DRAFT_2718430, partial [Gautieria morchelliformis]